MAQIALSNQTALNATLIPAAFITDYMPFADGICVKVYLYLVHAVSQVPQGAFSLKDMESTLNLTRESLCYALHYWQDRGLLRFSMSENGRRLQRLDLMPVAPSKPKTLLFEEDEEEDVPAQQQAALAQTAVTSAALSQASKAVVPPLENAAVLSVQNDLDFMALLHTLSSDSLLNRSLTARDADKLAAVYCMLQQKDDVVYTIVDYCLKNKKSASAKLRVDDIYKASEAVAAHFGENSLYTAKDAEYFLYDEYFSRFLTEIHFSPEDEEFSKAVLREMSPSVAVPSTSNLNTLHYWRSRFSDEVILYACSVTHEAAVSRMERNQNFNHWGYFSSVLNGWEKEGLFRLKEIKEKRQQHAQRENRTASEKSNSSTNSFRNSGSQRTVKKDYNDFPQHNYDYSKIADDVFNKIFEEGTTA